MRSPSPQHPRRSTPVIWARRALGALTLLVLAVLIWNAWDHQAFIAWREEAGVVPFFLAMALLPALGVPITPFFIVAGATFGTFVGLTGSAIARLGVAFALEEMVLPVLRDLGEGWELDPALISAEHFATNTLRPRIMRLLTMARSATAPRCIAAAPEPEDHELGVLSAAAVAADLGFRVTYLGARTPSVALERSIMTLRPDVVLVGAVTARAGRAFCDAPPALGDARLVVGGPGFAGLDDALPPGTERADSLTELRGALQRALDRNGATG